MRRLMFTLFLLAAILAMFILPAKIFASKPCDGSPGGEIACGASGSSGVPVSPMPAASLGDTVKVGIQYISIAIGIGAVVMIMVAGFRFVTSAGNEASIKSAKSTITYALVGLVIAALGQILVRFVLGAVK